MAELAPPATDDDIREVPLASLPGIPILLVSLGLYGLTAVQAFDEAFALAALAFFTATLLWSGLMNVQPNQGRVIQLFGNYLGTVRTPGLRFVNPFTTAEPVSLRVRNFDSDILKVNDHDGNPVDIAAVVVWRVVDTAEAVFVVDDYENYVKVQSEAALRDLATRYPYDTDVDGEVALRKDAAVVADQLSRQVQERLGRAGVEVLETRISHLAYAPEIASAMLQRQQAAAIIAARQRIVDGAVGMVHMALDGLSEGGQVELDAAQRAQMVSNLLVVLCSDRQAQPVVNTSG
jgi:hypothetical protein